MTDSTLTAGRRHLERQATTLFLATSLTMAVICGGIIVSGWFAGVIQDQYERIFWLGSVLALAGVLVLAAAAFPGGDDDARVIRRVRALSRIGIVLFAVAPVLCLSALVLDFFA